MNKTIQSVKEIITRNSRAFFYLLLVGVLLGAFVAYNQKKAEKRVQVNQNK